MEQRKARLIELLTKLAQIEPRIYQNCCHEVIGAEHNDALVELEKVYPELVIGRQEAGGKFRVTFPSLLATVTDILCGERVCFDTKGDDPETRETERFAWWQDPTTDHSTGV